MRLFRPVIHVLVVLLDVLALFFGCRRVFVEDFGFRTFDFVGAGLVVLTLLDGWLFALLHLACKCRELALA